MELESLTESDPTWGEQREVIPHSDAVAEVAISIFSLISFSAFCPAIRKKRVIQLNTALAPLSVEEPEPIAEPPPPTMIARPMDSPLIPLPEHKKAVETIFNTVAQGLMASTWNAMELNRLGGEIRPMHPFAFLLSAPMQSAKTIFQKQPTFLQNSVLGGIQEGIERELKKNNIFPHIEEFTKKIQEKQKKEDPTRPLQPLTKQMEAIRTHIKSDQNGKWKRLALCLWCE